MKIVTSKTPFEYLARGIKGTPTEVLVKVNEKGAEVDESTAADMKERFGANIEIKDAPKKKAKADDAPQNDAPQDDAPEEGTEKPKTQTKKK